MHHNNINTEYVKASAEALFNGTIAGGGGFSCRGIDFGVKKSKMLAQGLTHFQDRRPSCSHRYSLCKATMTHMKARLSWA